MIHVDSGFRTGEEIQQLLGLQLLPTVDDVDLGRRPEQHQEAVVFHDPPLKPVSHFHVAVAALRSAIGMSGPALPARLIQFTSTQSGEGKSTIANAVASSAAISGLRILLIDTCIRHPALSHRFAPSDNRGLVELLLGTAAIRDVMRYSADLKCMFLPAGRWNKDPVALLGSDRAKAVFHSLRGLFDYIVVDSPPAGRVIDPIVISEFSDQLIYVVRWASTPRAAVRHSIRQLSRYKKPAGIILNHVIST